MMFSLNGFLSANLQDGMNNIRTNFLPWFKVAEDINLLGMMILPTIQPTKNNNQQLTAGSLYGRIMTSYQATLLLTERGMLSDARTVIRAATEASIILGAIAIDTCWIDKLVLRQPYFERKIRNAWLSDQEAIAQLTPDQILRIKEVIAEIETDFHEVKALTCDPINIASLAVKTGSMGLYNAVYRVTSTDAAHTTTASLNRHIQTDERGNILQLQFGPETTDLADTLSNAISTIIYAIDVLIGLFNLDQFREKVQQHIVEWKALGIPSEYKTDMQLMKKGVSS